MNSITAIVIILVGAFVASSGASAQTEHGSSSVSGPDYQQLLRELKELRATVTQQNQRITDLETRQNQQPTSTCAGISNIKSGPATPPVNTARSASVGTIAAEKKGFDPLDGATLNLTMDGYYTYNFNSPVNRTNLLRAYDVSSNSFSLNQATIMFERAADVAAQRHFGVRVDLQYGQATETLQGSPANEPRPNVYRPVFQAYGTYIAPVGSGLSLDFGKWSSALGIENNYSKDQINYSRSYYFNFLPFYHMGFRAGYNVNNRVNLTYWLVNGTQQTEDFNGFKSQALIVTLKPAKTVTWNVNYFTGQEQRDFDFSGRPIRPTPNGRLHIMDSYVTWNATQKLTLAAEADYLVNRNFAQSSPAHVTGGVIYTRFQLTPKFAVAGRAEYLSDRGGLFSGVTQALKENTLTLEYKLADGLLARTEYRRDFSNRPFFLTSTPNLLKKEQNTATLGLIWWFGKKEGAW